MCRTSLDRPGEQAGTAPGCSLPFGPGQSNMLLSHSDTETRQNHDGFGGRNQKSPRKPGWGRRAAVAQVCLGRNASCQAFTSLQAGDSRQCVPNNFALSPKQPNSHRLPHVTRILSPHLPIPAGKAWHGTAQLVNPRGLQAGQGARLAFQTHRPKYLLMFPPGSALYQKPPHPFQTPIKTLKT